MSRVAELVPIRYGRMLVSAFTFYRGAALVMASDLAGTPRSGLNVQLCGDAHLMNFGAFGSPERRMVFDINDFDETAPGPFEWDVKRLAASVEIAARDNGFSGKDRSKVVLAAVEGYRTSMAEFAEMTNLEVWYTAIDVDSWLGQLGADIGAKALQARRSDRGEGPNEGQPSGVQQADATRRRRAGHHQRSSVDRAGVGPVRSRGAAGGTGLDPRDVREVPRESAERPATPARGVPHRRRGPQSGRRRQCRYRAWIVLLLGRDGNDPLFLQVKEAQASVLTAFVGPKRRVANGKRVVEGQHLMQATSDIFLGYTSVVGTDDVKRDYYFRQLRDWKGSAVVEAMDPDGLAVYARMCGKALARAHARSGDRVAIASYLGSSTTFDKAIAEFAALYADQNERDYDALLAAEADGRIEVRRGL